jgi:hypothetical protein
MHERRTGSTPEVNMATIEVSSASELSAALASYQGETTIVLNKGDYGSLKFSNLGTRGAVTLRSADPANKAVFEDLQFHSSTGITLDGLAFNPKQLSSEADGGWGLGFYSSSTIKVVNSAFYGEAGSLAKVSGVRLKTSAGVVVENNIFTDLRYGVQATESQDIKFLDNSLKGIRADGFQLADAQGVEIARNFGTNFKAEPYAHPDFVQFFTFGTTRSSENINIHDNVFLQGSGTGVQGIFLGNDIGLTYKNVTIANNLFYTSYWHGIAVYRADGVAIDNNTLVNVPNNFGTFEGKPMATFATWVLVQNVTNAQVTDNLANNIRFEASTGIRSGNVLSAWNGQKGLQTYMDVYANAWAGASANIDDFQAKSAYAGKGANLTPLHQAGAETAMAPSKPSAGTPQPVQSPPASAPRDPAAGDTRRQRRTELPLPTSTSLPELRKVVGVPPRLEPESALRADTSVLAILDLLS